MKAGRGGKGGGGRRPRQVADVVRAELAELFRDLRDPDIGFATVTAVEMSADLRSARVFVSVFGDDEAFAKSIVALRGAAHRLRGAVGRNCGLRYAPELVIVPDRSVRTGARVEELLRSLPETGRPAEVEREAVEGDGHAGVDADGHGDDKA